MNGMLHLDLRNIKSALISGAITIALTSILAIAGYIIGIGDIFSLDVRVLANIAVLSSLTTLVSLIKSLFTTNNGEFAGVIGIASPNKK